MKIENLLYLAGGLIAGAAAGLYAGKIYFEKKYNDRYEKDIADMEEYYGRTDEYARKSDDISKEEDSKDNQEDEESVPFKRRNAKNKHKKHVEVDYTKYYKEPIEEDEDEREIEEAEERNEELEAIRRSGKPPKIISQSALDEVPDEYEMECLIYYMYDGTITDEDDNEISDYDILIGDALTKFGFCDNDEKTIYVQNFELEKVYEIVKVYENFTLDNRITEGGDYREKE